MSESVSVMVGHGCSLEQAVERVGLAIGQPLDYVVNELGPRFTKDAMGISITAYGNHGLVDDNGIDFSSYPIEVQFCRYAGPDAELRNELCRIFAIRSASMIHDEYGAKCIVVYEAARVLHTFG